MKLLKSFVSLLVTGVLVLAPVVGMGNSVSAAGYTWSDGTGDYFTVTQEGDTLSLTVDHDNGDGVVTCPSVINGSGVSKLIVGNNISISTVVLGENPYLTRVEIAYTPLTSIDLSGCLNLEVLAINSQRLTSLDISHNPNLTQLAVLGYGSLKDLDISHNPYLINAFLGTNYYVPGLVGERVLTIDSRTNIIVGRNYMFRMFNPNSSEHFYTNSDAERRILIGEGWNYEGVAWIAPNEGAPVYRLYNPNAGDHHYTPSERERDDLINAGWRYEGIGWRTAGSDGVPLYRLYNPNTTGAGAHHYTASLEESNNLQTLGWRYEGIGWYGI